MDFWLLNFMVFLMDSERTGKQHIKQKQSTAVITYLSKTQSETLVHFYDLCFKNCVGITDFRFFPSFSEDR